MISSEILIAALGSAVIASIITSLFAKAQSDKNLKIENIIKERKAWRDNLRELVAETEGYFQAKDSTGIALIEACLVARLNPTDKEDLLIIEALNRIPDSWSRECFQEFIDRVSYLLKHDWERVKQETTTRISPQTLAIASLFVAFVATATELSFGNWGDLHIIKVSALWLCLVLFIAAIIASRPKDVLSFTNIWCWITNEPFRFKYTKRDKR